MADWTTELQAAIVAVWSGEDLAACPLFFNRTYPGGPYPYATFYLEAKHDTVCQGSTRIVNLQVNIFSDAATDAPVCELKAAALAALTGAALTMTDFVCTVRPQPTGERVFLNDDDHWQATILFTLRIH